MISDLELISLNQRGFIPGPDENEETFLKRVSFLQDLSENPQKIFPSPPFPLEEKVKRHHWDLKRCDLKKLFDIAPDWIAAFHHDKRLPFWQGAATWVFHDPEKNVKLALLQFRKSLKKGSHLGIYKLEEIMAHESVHAARMAFEETLFEEHFAYLTSTSVFRRVFGPIFRRSWEAPVFLTSLLGIPLSLFLWEGMTRGVYFAALALLSLGLIRLARFHRVFISAYKKLCRLTADHAFHVLLRLTDLEIRWFSKKSIEEIREYMQREKGKSLRWRLIYKAYFDISNDP